MKDFIINYLKSVGLVSPDFKDLIIYNSNGESHSLVSLIQEILLLRDRLPLVWDGDSGLANTYFGEKYGVDWCYIEGTSDIIVNNKVRFNVGDDISIPAILDRLGGLEHYKSYTSGIEQKLDQPTSENNLIMADTKIVIPTHPGFYWAKTGKRVWFNLIVEIHGTAPFLKIRAWNRNSNSIENISHYDIEEWGEKIVET